MKNSQFSADTVARLLLAFVLVEEIIDEADFKYGGLDAALHGQGMLQSLGVTLDELVERLEYEKTLPS